MSKEELMAQTAKWMLDHPNTYDRGRNEEAFWCVMDAHQLAQYSNGDINILSIATALFNRFKYCYR